MRFLLAFRRRFILLRRGRLRVAGLIGLAGFGLALSRTGSRRSNDGVNPEVGKDDSVENKYKVEPINTINRIHVLFSDSQRFGLTCPNLKDPRNPEQPKRLTRDDRGLTNNTCIRIEGYEYLFGQEIPGELPCLRGMEEKQRALVDAMLARRLQTVETSSCGRLFDAVAARAGVGSTVTFEGQAAIALEMVAAAGVEERYGFEIEEGPQAVLDFRPAIEEFGLEYLINQAGGLKAIIEHAGVPQAVEVMGLMRVIDQVGLKRVIDEVGPKRVIDELGPKRVLHEFDSESLVSCMSPAQRREVKRLLQ